MHWNFKKKQKCFFFSFWKKFSAYWICKKKAKKENKIILKNTKSNNTKPDAGYDRVEFYVDFVQVLLSAFMLGYVIGKKKREKED